MEKYKKIHSQEISKYKNKKHQKIQDVDPRAFEILISFMTGDAVRFQSVPTALNVIYAAKKYMVRKIDDLALKFIYKNINSHNVLLVLQNVLMLQEEPEVLPSAPSLALLEQVKYRCKYKGRCKLEIQKQIQYLRIKLHVQTDET